MTVALVRTSVEAQFVGRPFERLTRKPHLVENGVIMMSGRIDANSPTCEMRVRNSLFVLSEFPIIKIHMRSGGGSVCEARRIYDLLRECGKPIHIFIESACSADTIIAMVGHDIAIAADGEFLIHPVSQRLPPPEQGERYTAAMLRRLADDIDADTDRIIDLYARRTGLDRERLRGMMSFENYLTPREAVMHGFCDRVASR